MEPAIDTTTVGPRQPCPCGSGRRFKACHGSSRADRMIATRPFEGRVDEADWIALREIVPSATAPLRLADAALATREVTLATVLPMAWPGMVRGDGAAFVGLQTPGRSGDVSRDIGHAIMSALTGDPGSFVSGLGRDDSAPRIQDLLDPAPIEITLHQGFDYWVDGMEDDTGQLAAAMEKANAVIVPTERLTTVEAAYWCRMKERCHLRWVLPFDEDRLLDAMARLSAARELGLGAGTKYVGSFRAHGLLVPVWDLPLDMEAADVEAPAGAVLGRLEQAMTSSEALSDAERRARSNLLSRQLTLR